MNDEIMIYAEYKTNFIVDGTFPLYYTDFEVEFAASSNIYRIISKSLPDY